MMLVKYIYKYSQCFGFISKLVTYYQVTGAFIMQEITLIKGRMVFQRWEL